MSKLIRILNDLTINKIAAGEVVEGPYSVVKELIENAIDANATNITVEIKEGGQKYIRVSDNGKGIHEEDVELAFTRHATSKIQSLEDLASIISLGFRGEALASIAAVSQIQIITKPREQPYGISLDIVGGKVVNKQQVGSPDGTTIEVKNIFFNTPARLKFMKSSQAEATKIGEIMSRLALSQPNITLKYINNNNIMFTSPGNNNLEQTIVSILDKDLFKNLIYIENSTNDIKLYGYISQPTYVRGNRNFEIIFVNGRFIKSKLLYKAIETAYKEKLPINKFPVCVLNIDINPNIIDVNIHPSKTEIKFHDEEIIYSFIYKTILANLAKHTKIPAMVMKNINWKSFLAGNNPSTESIFKENKCNYNTHNNNKSTSLQISIEGAKKNNETETIEKEFEKNNRSTSQNNNIQKDLETTQENFLTSLLTGYRIIGQLFDTYIIIEKDLAMYLIDQHAAHERLVYNKMLQAYKDNNIITQQLLEAKAIELPQEDFLLLTEHIKTFNDLGFGIEVFGRNTIIIREVPLIMGVPRNFEFLLEVIDEFKNGNHNKVYFNEIIIRKSCREAIKAMDKLNIDEINALIIQLSEVPPPLTCPHGRPILLSLTKYEIEKNFKRIQ
ncbi:DNA mismatch repair protein MutL [Natronincola peptidivorans]|uniref:DNA mismatch repair protein MutL n=1 Tax=Natronincola peptidivorans TaxID=426128 RepID=A0A1H9YKU4_9FIRM|nr:DNA mismatch repair endonuclease MutL [Natronincola peptidivorans]SES69699.1 DNA mismatch repair protein MutL [Natronincola peptidivorans]